MDAPTVLFTIGATKAGTSWFFQYLEGHPEVHVRTLKELHYFDAFDEDRLDKEIAEQERGLARMERRITRHPEKNYDFRKRTIADRQEWLSVLRKGQEDPEAYLAYLSGGRSDEKVVADVTPAYALLSEERLAKMAKIAPDVRFLYVLRDPVERLWSHVRMIAARREKSGLVTRDRADRILRRTMRGKEPEIERRSDYKAAMEKLRAAVDPARYFVAFYDELFAGEALPQVCAFVGIEARKGRDQKVVHGGQPLDLSEEQRAEVRTWLAPQYEHVATRLGRLPESWTPEKVSA